MKMLHNSPLLIAISLSLLLAGCGSDSELISTTGEYSIVDTAQFTCYDGSGTTIDCPTQFDALYGQDAQHEGNTPSYTNNGDGTVTDNVTGLVWLKSADTDGDGDIDAADKMSYTNAAAYCENLTYAETSDWQLPNIKQLYSLMNFQGRDPSGYDETDTSSLVPFIDTNYFDFAYGDTEAGSELSTLNMQQRRFMWVILSLLMCSV